jgi:hypothetical protein
MNLTSPASFNKIKQCRRVATRYDKLAANYLAFIQLTSIRLSACTAPRIRCLFVKPTAALADGFSF